MRAAMERALRGIAGKGGRGKEDLSQELVYQAMETRGIEPYMRLLQDALELDPGNVDALLMMTSAVGAKGEERIEMLRGIVDTGAKRLGKKAFTEFVPHFWGFIETRPYMRARERLADALRTSGRIAEAVKEYEEMLVLNENDNQGIRYLLLPGLLALGRLDEARALMKRFNGEDEWNVVFAWGRVLERRLSHDDAGAAKALDIARKQNPHMEIYLKGHRKLPKNMPDSYSPGSKEEALCFVEPLLMAWQQHHEALGWLVIQEPLETKRTTP